MLLPKSLSKRHVVFLLFLITIDMVATMIWYYFFGINETNPALVGPIKQSPLCFVLVKLGMSLPGLFFIFKHINNKLSQIGLVLLLAWYSWILCIHWYILMGLLRSL